jgi:septum formation protein
MQQIVLASSSPFRLALLRRLGLPFETANPDVDETPHAGENPGETASRLARAKAHAVAPGYPGALIIGSDQVAVCNGVVLGKPGNHDNAVKQLRQMRGAGATFHTALCLLNTASGQSQSAVATNTVFFRDYSDEDIERYLKREQPYNCAGSAKAEGLGIVMIARIEGDDPNALIGLPLIELVTMLKREGVEVP